MGLNVIVTVKQVPDTHNVTGEAMKPDGTVNRAALPTIFNPEDLNALEEALKIKEQMGGKVTVITMGPPSAQEVLKESLYRGADEVILLSDRKFAGADTLATSYALKCAIEKIGKYDLILCGRQAIDGDTAQVGPQIAEKLKINQLSCILNIESIEQHSITVKRALDDGHEIVKSRFPVLLTVTAEANEPRWPSIKRVMTYKNITVRTDAYDEAYINHDERPYIVQWDAEVIGAEVERCGLSGSPTKVKKIQNIVLTTSEAKTIENSPAGITALIDELRREHIIG